MATTQKPEGGQSQNEPGLAGNQKAEKGEKAQFTKQERERGLAAIDKEEQKYLSLGQISSPFSGR